MNEQLVERRTQAQRKMETVSALTSAALELIGEQGMSGLTLAAVGARAGISGGLLLYHFGSKSGLINHLLDAAIDNRKMLFSRVKSGGLAGICEMLDTLPERINRNANESRGHQVLIIECALSTDPQIRQRIADYNRTMRDMFSALFAEELEKIGARHAVDPDLIASAHMAGIRGAGIQWVLEGEAFDLDATIQVLKDLLCRKFRDIEAEYGLTNKQRQGIAQASGGRK